MDTLSKIEMDRIDMIMSLLDSIIKAGGARRTYRDLKYCTLEELVLQLGQNGVRFHVEKQK